MFSFVTDAGYTPSTINTDTQRPTFSIIKMTFIDPDYKNITPDVMLERRSSSHLNSPPELSTTIYYPWPGDLLDEDEDCESCDEDCDCEHCDEWILNVGSTTDAHGINDNKIGLREEFALQADEKSCYEETILAAALCWQRESKRLFDNWKGVKDRCMCDLRRPRIGYEHEPASKSYTDVSKTYNDDLVEWGRSVPWVSKDNGIRRRYTNIPPIDMTVSGWW